MALTAPRTARRAAPELFSVHHDRRAFQPGARVDSRFSIARAQKFAPSRERSSAPAPMDHNDVVSRRARSRAHPSQTPFLSKELHMAKKKAKKKATKKAGTRKKKA
jgi:hypothetical protein